jgi:hypothetical protein
VTPATGGTGNTATGGTGTTASGGTGNTATGGTVSGGNGNTATGVTPTLVGTHRATSLPVGGTAVAPATTTNALPFTGGGELPEELALGGFLIALGAAARRLGRPRTTA